MKLKKIISSLMVLALSLSIVACKDATKKEDPKSDAGAVDLFDIAQYKSKKDSSEWTIAVVTKDPTGGWFKRMEVGIDEFAENEKLNVIHKGPATPDAASQVQVVDDMISQGVDAICIVPIDPGALEASLKRAMEQGIVVVSHEASNLKNTLFDVEAFTADDFGKALMDALAGEMGKEGKYAQMAGYTTSTTHMEYLGAAKNWQVETYKDMELINGGAVPTVESEESFDKSYERAKEVLKVDPDLAGFMGVASTDIPGIAKAAKELGLGGKLKIIGVGTPNDSKMYVNEGIISKILLWDPKDSGYAMCKLAQMILNGELVGDKSDLGIKGYESVNLIEGINRCLIGQAPLEVTKDNIDQYDF